MTQSIGCFDGVATAIRPRCMAVLGPKAHIDRQYVGVPRELVAAPITPNSSPAMPEIASGWHANCNARTRELYNPPHIRDAHGYSILATLY